MLRSVVVYMVKLHPGVGVANISGGIDETGTPWLSYFFVKKIPLSRRVGYVMDGSMGE